MHRRDFSGCGWGVGCVYVWVMRVGVGGSCRLVALVSSFRKRDVEGAVGGGSPGWRTHWTGSRRTSKRYGGEQGVLDPLFANLSEVPGQHSGPKDAGKRAKRKRKAPHNSGAGQCVPGGALPGVPRGAERTEEICFGTMPGSRSWGPLPALFRAKVVRDEGGVRTLTVTRTTAPFPLVEAFVSLVRCPSTHTKRKTESDSNSSMLSVCYPLES